MATAFPQTLGNYSDPYAAMIEAQRAKLNQPQAPTYSPEEQAQRVAQNQREYGLGMLGVISGDQGLGNVGGQVLRQAIAARQPRVTERGTVDPLRGTFNYSPDFLQQQEEGKLGQLEQRSAAMRGQFDQARVAASERMERDRERAQDQMALRSMMGAGQAANRQSQQDARTWRAEDTMRGDFDRLTKDLREEIGATTKINQIISASAGKRPDAITQQSLVILLNKFLDPGSVVREGEFDRVVKAQGLEGRAANLIDYIGKGEPLNDQAIAQISQLANLYNQAATARMSRYGQQYSDIASQRGLDAASIITDPTYRPQRGGGLPNAVNAATGADDPLGMRKPPANKGAR